MGSTAGAGAGKKARAVRGRLQGHFSPGDTAATSAATCATVRARPSQHHAAPWRGRPTKLHPQPRLSAVQGDSWAPGGQMLEDLGAGTREQHLLFTPSANIQAFGPRGGVVGGGGQSPLAGQRRGPGRTPGTEPGMAQNSHRVCWIRGRSTGETPLGARQQGLWVRAGRLSPPAPTSPSDQVAAGRGGGFPEGGEDCPL